MFECRPRYALDSPTHSHSASGPNYSRYLAQCSRRHSEHSRGPSSQARGWKGELGSWDLEKGGADSDLVVEGAPLVVLQVNYDGAELRLVRVDFEVVVSATLVRFGSWLVLGKEREV